MFSTVIICLHILLTHPGLGNGKPTAVLRPGKFFFGQSEPGGLQFMELQRVGN